MAKGEVAAPSKRSQKSASTKKDKSTASNAIDKVKAPDIIKKQTKVAEKMGSGATPSAKKKRKAEDQAPPSQGKTKSEKDLAPSKPPAKKKKKSSVISDKGGKVTEEPSAEIPLGPLEEQARIIQVSYDKDVGPSASYLEQAHFEGSMFTQLPERGTLQLRIKATEEAWGITAQLKKVQAGSADPGGPCLLILTSSAVRAGDLIRELHQYNKKCHIPKLFAKHIK
ncbi:hypothetical protein CYMTET_54452, partial [Cymbomonas tetramitiformis]